MKGFLSHVTSEAGNDFSAKWNVQPIELSPNGLTCTIFNVPVYQISALVNNVHGWMFNLQASERFFTFIQLPVTVAVVHLKVYAIAGSCEFILFLVSKEMHAWVSVEKEKNLKYF